MNTEKPCGTGRACGPRSNNKLYYVSLKIQAGGFFVKAQVQQLSQAIRATMDKMLNWGVRARRASGGVQR